MESIELRVFRQVAYAKSITKAAENMGYVQSNVTAHIKKLEMELNTILFVRHSKGVTLTQDGEWLLYQTEKILELIDKTSQSFQREAKHLNIGTTQTIAGYLLPQCLIEYQKQFPDILISVRVLEQYDLEEQLETGKLDCIITNSQHNFLYGKHILKYEEELMLIAPCSYKTLEELKQCILITNDIISCPYRKILMDWWNLYQYELPKIIELDTVEAILNAVSMGMGISLIPKYVVQNRYDMNRFYVQELQTTAIHMWIRKNECSYEYDILKNIIEQQLKYNIDN